MKNIIILIAAIVIVAGAFFIFDETTEGPAEEVGEAVDNAISDATD